VEDACLTLTRSGLGDYLSACLPGCLSKVCLPACLTVLECLYLRVSISRVLLAAARSAREGE
jgi:hypothetical protein